MALITVALVFFALFCAFVLGWIFGRYEYLERFWERYYFPRWDRVVAEMSKTLDDPDKFYLHHAQAKILEEVAHFGLEAFDEGFVERVCGRIENMVKAVGRSAKKMWKEVV